MGKAFSDLMARAAAAQLQLDVLANNANNDKFFKNALETVQQAD